MGVYDCLSELGSFDYSNHFNGALADYLKSHDDENKDLFNQLLSLNSQLCVVTQFELNINNELIANKKIGYRDACKIPEGSLKIPYIIYWKDNEKQRAVILNGNNYIEARGMYYCITEPENVFNPYNLEVSTNFISDKNHNELYKMIEDLMNSTSSVGYIQRHYDNMYINDIEKMKIECIETAKEIFAEAQQQLLQTQEKTQRAEIINGVVARAFLLKKALYVKYMMNKYLLNDRHSGNVSEQRRFAKAYSDEIEIVPYFDLWNTKENE